MTHAIDTVRGSVAWLPAEPGVYRFRDAQGRALYIGRATQLRQRVARTGRTCATGGTCAGWFRRSPPWRRSPATRCTSPPGWNATCWTVEAPCAQPAARSYLDRTPDEWRPFAARNAHLARLMAP